MRYSEEDKKDILRKVVRLVVNAATRTKPGFAPDIIIEPALTKANELIEKCQNEPDDFDIWRNGRLDLYTSHIARNMIMQNYDEYRLTEENIEAVNALIEAEEMLGDKVSDAELADLFDYTPEELARLRILIKYLNGIDREKAYAEFVKKYEL